MSAGRKAEAIKAVSALFPKAFGPRRPLKYKIHEDLLSAGIEHKVAAAALSSHCNNPRYLMSMVEGATRVDLQGQPAGVVTAEEAARAQQRLAERRLKQKPEAEKPKEPEKPVKPKPKAPLQASPQASPKTKAELFRKGRNASTKPVVVEIRRQPSRPKRTFTV
jgi:ProP effector